MLRVLIADDEGIIRMGLKKMLTELGHHPISAVNGREALEMARRHQPDLAILDIDMPFTTGIQTAKALNKNQPIPVIFLTAYSDPELIEKATDLPIVIGYLVKPIKTAELNAVITLAMKRFAEGQAGAEKAARLEKSLRDRKLIDRAKGKLMGQGLTEAEAYRQLQQNARQKNLSIAQVAETLLK